MFKNESFEPTFDIEDFEDASFYPLLTRLPKELAKRHLKKILLEEFSDSETIEYLESILNERREAMTVTEFSDPEIERLFEGQKETLLAQLDTTVFNSSDNELGFGTTAKVKSFTVTHDNESIVVAVKYLVEPKVDTVSAAIEHDILKEVERIKHVEELESSQNFQYLSVPHPYFHHKNSQLQCYGMQVVNGPNLFQVDEMFAQEPPPIELLTALAAVDEDTLSEEIDVFFKNMHSYCLHKDIKRRNIMFDLSGKFYVIDFGQSILVTDISEDNRQQFDVLKEGEVEKAKKITLTAVSKAKNLLANTQS